MEQLKMYYRELIGSNYEVGKQLGEYFKQVPAFIQNQIAGDFQLTNEEEKSMRALFDTYCPGINEELAGYSEALGIDLKKTIYYAMTYLRPGCSQMALLPSKTEKGHVLLARNYEFNEAFEDNTFCLTKIQGRYAHIGSTIALFGRTDGMNEWGLGVSQSSAGLPVANIKYARKPAIVGLQFWAVIRALLENCKDVDEAIDYVKDMPIAYNINLIVADRKGKATLIETLEGRKAFKSIDSTAEEQYLHSTNHMHLEELKAIEPKSMRHSVVRYKLIKNTLDTKKQVTKDDIKTLLSTEYPKGLCCHYYEEFFGTLRGIIFDLTEGKAEVCFGSTALNKWHSFSLDHKEKYKEYLVNVKRERMAPELYEWI
ncbi:C45 family autoproteolytic acyltransferase/hydolase [Alkaliphilus peptidifermentans]|uniref:Acyl-coenzyme A:6-aminopenicillanic acid acyl-transferase n=1 Tax=Alkaliphilus peptidifermentans DSM 18978 TaxID=1120976 RepID=A0A1G5G4L9_9FIRM|nr:C45 family peptidase [Alkaliphilus peptidifermentans]SCY46200.1 Acyl-coenzyme A:6-aminopenicillanic acid acyl-transferase [Alkaliphilus peptidifermentans DSM 18978]